MTYINDDYTYKSQETKSLFVTQKLLVSGCVVCGKKGLYLMIVCMFGGQVYDVWKVFLYFTLPFGDLLRAFMLYEVDCHCLWLIQLIFLIFE